jgi:putative SOS response-associated peptidase YedK
MCGRVRVPEDYSELKIDLKLHEIVPHSFAPRWNVPPTEMLPVVTSKDGKRRLEPMRWGLIPSWAKDAKVGFSTFNARADNLDTKPAFKGPWAKGRRCVVVTSGFYEWKKLNGGKDRQPYAVALGNRGPMLMAGLWDVWKNPADGQWLRSCTIITTDSNEMVATVHDRMPAIVGPDGIAPWLGEEPVTLEELKAILRPYPSERMTMWPVDKRVGNVKNEGPELAEPLRPETQPALI